MLTDQMKRIRMATRSWLAVGAAALGAGAALAPASRGALPQRGPSRLPPTFSHASGNDTPAIHRLPPVGRAPGQVAGGIRPFGPIVRLPGIDAIAVPIAVPDTIALPEADELASEFESQVRGPQMGGGERSPPPRSTASVAEDGPSYGTSASEDLAPYFPPAGGCLYAPTPAELTPQLLPSVQRGFGLARRGAVFAAQTEFIQVLRRVAQANDLSGGRDNHSRALAEGLRALDEAGDFVPEGIELEADLDVGVIASSHRTPLAHAAVGMRPLAALTIYHEFAEERLAAAIGGQQAGSMALCGLGMVHARLADQNGSNASSTQFAITMHSAALAACPANPMAANELGVLLCRNGHAAEAAALFRRTIDVAPSAVAYHNLAVAEEKMGMHAQATANARESERLAAWERAGGSASKRAGVMWVTPQELARVSPPPVPAVPLAPAAGTPINPSPTVGPPPERSPWRKAIDMAKSLTNVSGENDAQRR
jgi:hypothetical protein